MRFAAPLAALLVGAAVPVVAQVPGEMPYGAAVPQGNPMFAGMSDAGRATMRAAMREADPRSGKEATRAARDRMLAVLDADRLDVIALRRAMDDEREAANAAKVRHQVAMIAGLQQLSLADRRIFVANAEAVRSRMAGKIAGEQARRMSGTGLPQH